ncbi:NADH-quinone oxidoreductase subunit D [bacterium (Candidatus Blackallbacteria) CG17_big_fil_post_rev_8_21_14_2_50_48_46]|uniref:NADH-quinone oxidoreductase subunit D n=1 Tax=bacterium (Candidatus Blackallbacteria) CG17_big_fil_post_rev_8_21_14_2_50_48_46 TaxID=2014261 RepID=A0A2M7G5T9_9BACT|nr:MAG: NADH-quinone oxidoreductase subunit D [bacterium (Candidatus Blackallbacteria) CG18_big_fil_WC_8_21_14_2_50_49_26]PIW17354.1 MAG: NADH-quinone oxidoreductase subunit D [bacterium (Candidatus Blackallbacteria) CG17_big_fil_post_rev_8_21_14_2_50_48_46]PIW47414.1 MAG: NADH-quinone oxidoreductase subunit D [bacterium (Candidatus Blackallbacteria) CG13_big_fil_rev_8_21_14_2_50_49_14]
MQRINELHPINQDFEPEFYRDLHTDLMFLNLGPSHPASHGTLRTLVALDGETIKAGVCEIGYLHRGFEKTAENRTYDQVIPYTDRLNYVSAIMNNVGFAKAVESLIGVEITPRCQALRVIVSELMRIVDHLVCIGANLVDIGALTNFWYLFNKREQLYDILDKLTGARLTNSFTRIGGLARDAYEGFDSDVLHVLGEFEIAMQDVLKLVFRNKIFLKRTQGVGIISQEDALSYAFTGPCLRATGIPYDLRKEFPYYGYENYEFDVAVGEVGDTYDRIMVRFEEITQSIRIVRQALKTLPDGPVNSDDKRVSLPPKKETYVNIEGLINHFKHIYEGVKVPAGEYYDATEAANGELGFYIVSDGSGHPFRVRCRPPCFTIFSAYPQLIEGGLIADAIAILGSINIIAGELER